MFDTYNKYIYYELYKVGTYPTTYKNENIKKTLFTVFLTKSHRVHVDVSYSNKKYYYINISRKNRVFQGKHNTCKNIDLFHSALLH